MEWLQDLNDFVEALVAWVTLGGWAWWLIKPIWNQYKSKFRTKRHRKLK